MRGALPALLIISCLVCGPVAAGLPPVVGDTPLPTLAPMIKKVSPTVVNIATRGTIRERGPQNPLLDDPFFRRFFDVPPDTGPRERPFQSAGSGVIFDAKNGYILTNAHVVENANEITVTLQDGRDLKAEVVGSDAPSDVAVLRVKGEGLQQVPLGDSSHVEVGDFVVAIGNPFGLQHTVTSGIISGLSRSGINPDGYEDFIQTDASINPGNSGGALVNTKGEVIGINTAILSRSGGNQGVGFAIPIDMVRQITAQLKEKGAVTRARLGISIQELTPQLASALGVKAAKGAVVGDIQKDGPAANSGLEKDDVIVALNGKEVDSRLLRFQVGSMTPGTTVDLKVLRGPSEHHVTVKLDTMPNEAQRS